MNDEDRERLDLTDETSRGGFSVGRLIEWDEGGRQSAGQIVGFNTAGQIVAQSAKHRGWYLIDPTGVRLLN